MLCGLEMKALKYLLGATIALALQVRLLRVDQPPTTERDHPNIPEKTAAGVGIRLSLQLTPGELTMN